MNIPPHRELLLVGLVVLQWRLTNVNSGKQICMIEVHHMVDNKEINRCVEFHKALSNPVRLQIVEVLLEGELCQCEIAPRIGVAQSTISSYLSQLVRAGVLSERREGQRKMYWISSKKIADLLIRTRKVLAEELT